MHNEQTHTETDTDTATDGAADKDTQRIHTYSNNRATAYRFK